MKWGAEGANSDENRNETLRQKDCNLFKSWKAPVFSRGTEGDNSRASREIISQVKRQEEGDTDKIVLPPFILGESITDWMI